MIEELPALFSVFPEMKMYFIGDGTEREALEEKCQRLGIEGNVVFTGAVSLLAVYQYLGKSLLNVSASVGEAFGLVNAEAISAGTPILANRVGGIVDILIHGENGFFFDPDKKGDFVASVQKVIGEDWESLSASARSSFVEKHSSSDENLEEQVAFLDDLLWA